MHRETAYDIVKPAEMAVAATCVDSLAGELKALDGPTVLNGLKALNRPKALHGLKALRAPKAPRFAETVLAVVALLLMFTSGAVAEPAVPQVAIDSPPLAVVLETADLWGTIDGTPILEIAQIRDVPVQRLDDLLTVRAMPASAAAESTDEAIAAAVAKGSNPDLERPNPFRKRNTDLFRTERPIEIGNQEMVLRLRLRAKTRRAMSVELRF